MIKYGLIGGKVRCLRRLGAHNRPSSRARALREPCAISLSRPFDLLGKQSIDCTGMVRYLWPVAAERLAPVKERRYFTICKRRREENGPVGRCISIHWRIRHQRPSNSSTSQRIIALRQSQMQASCMANEGRANIKISSRIVEPQLTSDIMQMTVPVWKESP